MPRRDLPMNPARLLEFGEVPPPADDSANVPSGIPQSKPREDRPSSMATPIRVKSVATTGFAIPAEMSVPGYQLRRGQKRSKF
jgi:hypothetical protein